MCKHCVDGKIKQGEEGRLWSVICSKIMYYLSNFWYTQFVTVATISTVAFLSLLLLTEI